MHLASALKLVLLEPQARSDHQVLGHHSCSESLTPNTGGAELGGPDGLLGTSVFPTLF